jgi:hypothetical protein
MPRRAPRVNGTWLAACVRGARGDARASGPWVFGAPFAADPEVIAR